MLLLGIDCETTGFDCENDFITELGYVVWDTEKQAPLCLYNFNINWPDMPELSKEIQQITGITPDHLKTWGLVGSDLMNHFMHFGRVLMQCNYAVAHNAPFDRGFVTTAFKKLGLEMPAIHWIDTCVDIPFGADKKSRNLNHACADHKLMPNEFAHRALFDVMQMFKLLNQYDINKVVERANTPNVTLEAITRKPWEDPSPEGEKDTDKAKKHGFRWDGTNKTWTRLCKASEVDAIKEQLSFPIKVVV